MSPFMFELSNIIFEERLQDAARNHRWQGAKHSRNWISGLRSQVNKVLDAATVRHEPKQLWRRPDANIHPVIIF